LLSISMRKRKDNQLDLEHGAARTIGHTGEELDCSRSSVYELVRRGLLELIYLDPDGKKLPRVTTRSISKLVGEQSG
jgi:hypothetical protein